MPRSSKRLELNRKGPTHSRASPTLRKDAMEEQLAPLLRQIIQLLKNILEELQSKN
jgi:hypothetical protein